MDLGKIEQFRNRTIRIYKKLDKKKVLLVLGIFSFVSAGIYSTFQKNQRDNLSASLVTEVELGALPIYSPNTKFGFAIDTFQVSEGIIKSGQFFADILQDHNIDYASIDKLVKNSEETFNVGRLIAGKPYTVLAKDSTQKANYLIYEPNALEYIVFDLEKLEAEKVVRPIEIEQKQSAGIIQDNLWNTMVDNGMSLELASKMEDALQWSIDFHRVQKGDRFKLVYDEKFVDGKSVGVSEVYAAYYKSGEDEFHAIYYDSEDIEKAGYYDLEGRPMNKGFLKSPLKSFRISSSYNLRRFHPVLKRVKAHLGTDYAAPYGTPIHAVGNGVVVKAGYTKGNGRYVKIKHDDTYQTQYLHMQRFAKGMKVGKLVKQNEVIGYVGSTGLATGPHVCFRFWKNGKQVNHRALKFPPAQPLPEEDMANFVSIRDGYLKQLEALTFKTVAATTVAEKEVSTTIVGNP